MHDFLTTAKLEIYKKLRNLKKNNKIFSVFTFNNNVYVKITENDDKKLIRSMEELRASNL